MNEKFDFIYSVAFLHMFVSEKHRNKFWSFIKEHLKDTGKCLICVLGNGNDEFVSDIEKAFEKTERIVMNNNKKINVATTSCKIVNWEHLENEIKSNKLLIENRWISTDIPEFSSSMCVVVKKKLNKFVLPNTINRCKR